MTPGNSRTQASTSVNAAISPPESALPARLWPSGPGNMSGKMVRTVACHMVCSIACAKRSILEHAFGWIDHDAPARDIDHRHGDAGEWQHHGVAFALLPQLQNIAGTEIVDRHHGAERAAIGRDRCKPDQVGMIEFVRLRCRQAVA